MALYGTVSIVTLVANEEFSGSVGLEWPGGEVEGSEQGYAKT